MLLNGSKKRKIKFFCDIAIFYDLFQKNGSLNLNFIRYDLFLGTN